MHDLANSEVWVIDEATMWPPSNKPTAPFGTTMVEIVRSCPLRACFDRSPSYPRRRSFDVRIGMAFHLVLESLGEHPPAGAAAERTAEARRRFEQALADQQKQARETPRESALVPDQQRIDLALEALLAAAHELAQMPGASVGAGDEVVVEARSKGLPTSGSESEVYVRSRDGRFHGRIDRVNYLPEGVRLVDYKSARRNDLPGRYVRQLQLYALLWHETRGSWPHEAWVVYPLMGRQYRVEVTPALCQEARVEAEAALAALDQDDPFALARPGDTCKVCEFRPWCRPFWAWQASEGNTSMAMERAYWGFEGELLRVEQIQNHWRVEIRWRDATVLLVAKVNQLPHLALARPSMRVRVLEMRLQGARNQPRAVPLAQSELFLLRDGCS